jgi:hypothetical protein
MDEVEALYLRNNKRITNEMALASQIEGPIQEPC